MTDLVERLRMMGNAAAREAADEIERLRAEVARANTVENMWRAECLKAQQALVDERARLSELERDAARYRWLRDNRDQSELWIRHYEFGPLNGDAADQAIDAAMREGKG